MRRIVLAWVVVAALAAGLAGLALAAQPGARAAAVVRAAPVSHVAPAIHRARVAPVAGGSTCFVDVPECSQTPCVELVRGAQSAVLVSPGAGRVRPGTTCPRRAVRPGPVAVPALGAIVQAVPARPVHPPAHRAASAAP